MASVRGFCPRGGQDGIVVSKTDMRKLAEAVGSKYLDEFIPLPGMTIAKQAETIKANQDEESSPIPNVEYWETKEGSHGWCSIKTGRVVQWG